ncbi:hypothetical protein IWZ00DRAFT_441434 [Phyllosticta capitalensis]|uniref:Ketoreductase domain-containing protein n=1 Tax=Phyllosticta capitalensis TaxID=121624 RepID=A0ABR1YGF2_9PEZI
MGSNEPPRDYWIHQWKYTPTVHRDVYPAIDPKSPALSQKGKIVVISGASSGIGAEGLAPAFAHAGAEAIVIAARRLENLRKVEANIAAINPAVKTLSVATDVTDAASVANLFQTVSSTFGRPADVLVSNAAALQGLATITASDPDVWRREVDINLNGPYLLVREFLLALPAEENESHHKPTFIAISSSASVEIIPGLGNYCISKGALNRLVEFVAAENPRVAAVAMHPGIIRTAMSIDEFAPFEGDTMELVGGMTVWLATDAARWLSGRYVGVNWDVEELVASKQKVLERDELKVALKGSFGESVGQVDAKAYKVNPF